MPVTAKNDWGTIGLDGQVVYAISHREISALVHNCPMQPYEGGDETVKDWVWTHGQVVDAAWAEADSVLPMTFDCIIRPAEGHTPDETVTAWLVAEYDGFRAELASLKGKVELGVQVIWQTDAIAELLMASDAEIKDEQGIEVRFTGPWPPYSFVAKSTAPNDA